MYSLSILRMRFFVLAVFFTLGCSKTLPKEKAKQLVEGKTSVKGPICTFETYKKTMSLGIQGMPSFYEHTVPKMSDVCENYLKSKNIITSVKRPPHGSYRENSKETFVEVTSKDNATCTNEACKWSIICGKSSVHVESVTTESKKATIKYKFQSTYDDAIKSDEHCLGKPDGEKTFEAIANLDDEGNWSLK